VLVSNAGLSHPQPLEDITAAQFDEMLAVNLRAPFLLAQCAAAPCGNGVRPDLARLPGRRVHRRHRRPAYAASKAGLHGLTQLLASRLAATGVTVNALAPALAAETRMLPGDPAQLRGRCPPAGSASHPRSPTSPRPT